MARTWLHAGARSVIASPVSVNDDDACELLSAVHASLATGAAPAVALADATRVTGITAPFLSYGAGW
jgi:CHAT domain-containing protein